MRRVLGVVLTGVIAAACIALAPPAGAIQQPSLKLGLGETVTVEYPALVGPNYQQGRRPASCSSSTRVSCDTIPVELDIDPAKLAANGQDYVFIVRTEWTMRAEQTVPAVGVVVDDQINTFVYTDPPRVDEEGTIVEEQSSFMYPSPTELTFVAPPSNKYLITVENMYGYNDGYKLTVIFMDTGAGPGADLSEDAGATFDLSSNDGFAITESFSGDAAPSDDVTFSDIAADAVSAGGLDGSPRNITLDLAALTVDNDLDSLNGVDNAAVMQLAAAQDVGDLANQGPPRIREASRALLLVWLLVVPAAIAGGLVVFARRRRSGLAFS